VARQFGFDNWNALAAKLGDEPASVEQAAPWGASNTTIPVLRIFSVEAAEQFYDDFLDFTMDFGGPSGEEGTPFYGQVSRAATTLHLSEHRYDPGPGSNGPGVDERYRRLAAPAQPPSGTGPSVGAGGMSAGDRGGALGCPRPHHRRSLRQPPALQRAARRDHPSPPPPLGACPVREPGKRLTGRSSRPCSVTRSATGARLDAHVPVDGHDDSVTGHLEPSRTLEMIMTLPTSIPFARDALGKRYNTRLAGHQMTLVLPSFRWRPTIGRFLPVAPALDSIRRNVDWDEYLHSYSAWGKVSRWQSRPPRRILVAHVSHVLAVVPLPKRLSHRQVGELGAELSSASYPWWLRLRDWIEITTPHLLEDFEPPENRALISNTRAWSWDGRRRRSVPIAQMIHVYGDSGPGVRPSAFEAIARRTGEGADAPTMHLFLRIARLALWQSNYRTAVLEASTAAELALRQLLDLRLNGVDRRVAEAMSNGSREVGRLVDLLQSLGVGLPSRFKERLLHVRNRAIHRGEEPTRNQATDVVNLVRELVEQVAPSRHLLDG
jgi:hypothetical protein